MAGAADAAAATAAPSSASAATASTNTAAAAAAPSAQSLVALAVFVAVIALCVARPNSTAAAASTRSRHRRHNPSLLRRLQARLAGLLHFHLSRQVLKRRDAAAAAAAGGQTTSDTAEQLDSHGPAGQDGSPAAGVLLPMHTLPAAEEQQPQQPQRDASADEAARHSSAAGDDSNSAAIITAAAESSDDDTGPHRAQPPEVAAARGSWAWLRRAVAVRILRPHPLLVRAARSVFRLDLATAPPLGVLVLLACRTIGAAELGSGIVGDPAGIQPYAILILVFSLAYICISIDETGLFRNVAFRITVWGGTSGLRLFTYLFILSAVMTLVASNDVVALTVTPILCYFAATAKIDAVPFLISGFMVSNVSSMGLYVGNPTNVIVSQASGVSILGFTRIMGLPTLAASLVCYALSLAVFWRAIPRRVAAAAAALPPQEYAVADPTGTAIGCVLLLVCLTALMAVPAFAPTLPVWVVTLPFAVLQLAVDAIRADRLGGLIAPLRRAKGGDTVRTSVEDGNGMSFLTIEGAGESSPSLKQEPLSTVKDATGTESSVVKDATATETNAEESEHSLPGRAVVAVAHLESPAPAFPGKPERDSTVSAKLPSSLEDVATLQAAFLLTSVGAPTTAIIAVEDADDVVVEPGSTGSAERSDRHDTQAAATDPVGGDGRSRAPRFARTRAVLRRLPYRLVPFALGMFVLVEALDSTGWTGRLGEALGGLRPAPAATVFTVAFVSAAACAVLNNLPATMLFARALTHERFLSAAAAAAAVAGGGEGGVGAEAEAAARAAQRAGLFALVVGSNVGANLLFAGSLAGLMWSAQLLARSPTAPPPPPPLVGDGARGEDADAVSGERTAATSGNERGGVDGDGGGEGFAGGPEVRLTQAAFFVRCVAVTPGVVAAAAAVLLALLPTAAAAAPSTTGAAALMAGF